MEKTTQIWLVRILIAMLLLGAAIGVSMHMGWVKVEIVDVRFY